MLEDLEFLVRSHVNISKMNDEKCLPVTVLGLTLYLLKGIAKFMGRKRSTRHDSAERAKIDEEPCPILHIKRMNGR